MIKRLFLFFVVLFFWHTNYAQNYNMNTDATYQTCTGNFYDNGGPNGNYGNAITRVVTFCPDFPESSIQVSFSDFDLQANHDFLFVYDGPDVTYPLIATLTGNELPLTQVASGSNPTGCLTFRFISDATVNGRGWDAQIECVTPCQVINAYLENSFPTRDRDNIIKACIDQEIYLKADADFSGNGAGSIYTWDLDNGQTVTGKEVRVAYTEPGIYRVNVTVTDRFGCRNNNILNQIIQISPDPTVTVDLPSNICFGVPTVVTVEAEYERITREVTPPVSGTTFLPDGNNNIYSTSVVIDSFENDQILTSGNQLAKVCINMEHSFSNDISIRLISPNGTVVLLHNRGGGGTYIGQANDDGTLEPGIGETYCFTMDAATILIDGPTIIGGSNPPGAMFVPGDYLPVQNFDRFVGSPVNGVWTLQVHDQAAIDNGYIFWWALEFSDEILPAEFTFKPEFESISVPMTNGVIEINHNQFTFVPEMSGEQCFDITVYNDFGCPYIKRVCTTVDEEIVLNQARDLKACAENGVDYTFDFQSVFSDLSNNQLLVYSIHRSEQDAIDGVNEISSTQTQNVNQGVVTYWVRAYNFISECFKVTSFNAQVVNCTLNLVNLADLSICEGEPNSFDIAQYSSVVYYNNLDYTVSYYNSEEDAISQTNAIDEDLLSSYQGTNNETIWVRVNKNNDPQVYGITSFKIFIYPVPFTFDLTPVYACEISGTGLGRFNLTPVIRQASGMSPNVEVTFYRSVAEAQLGDLANSLPLDYTGYQGEIYVRAFNLQTGCYTVMPLITNVVDAPRANIISPLEVCDTNDDGFAFFNLKATEVLIAGNPIPTGVQVTYHETLADANNYVNSISNTEAYQNSRANSQTIYVRVGYINSVCSSIVPLELIVNSSPNIAQPTPLQSCNYPNNGGAIFDLTSKNIEILNGLNPVDFEVTFYLNDLNANNKVNAIESPQSYTSVRNSTVSVRVENVKTGCFKVVKLNLIVNSAPVVAKPIQTYQLCDDNFDGFQVFDLNSRIPLIIGNQTGLKVTFHYTAADANVGANPLVSPYQNVSQNVQTLFVRVERLNTGCFTTSTMDIRVNPAPVLNVPASPFEVCSNTDTNFGTIDLTIYNAQLLNGGPAYQLTYFETQANAQNNVLPILNPAAYNNLQANNPSVWVRASNPVTGCFSVYKLNFKLLVSPKIPLTLPQLVACDTYGDNYDGKTPIDLTQQTPLILAVQTIPGNYQVRYFTSLAQANLGENWIVNPEVYVNITNPQTIWVRVQNANHPNSCFVIGSFEIKVNTPLPIIQPSPITVCNDALPNDERSVFDLTLRENQITQGQIFGVTLKYYLTQDEAKAGINSIANPTSYTNVSNPQTIWVAVENQHGCFSYTTLTIRVLPLPEPNFNVLPLQKCESEIGSDEATFDLTLIQPDLSNGNTTLSYRYFLTEQEAINNVGAIRTPDEYITGSTTLYVRVSNNPSNLTESCFVVVPIRLVVNSIPRIGRLTPLLACEFNTSGTYKFDLRDKNSEVLGNLDPAVYDVRYYVTQAAALIGESPIPYLYTIARPYSQMIWVRLQNKITGCYAIATFELKVEEKVFAYKPTTGLVFCDTDGVNDGFGPANISTLNSAIISNQALANNLAVRYYSSWANYNARIVSPTNSFPITTNPQLVIAEVYNTIEGELCTATVEFYVTMSKAPSFDPIPNGYICTDLRTGAVSGYMMDTGLKAEDYRFTWLHNGTVLTNSGPSYEATVPGNYQVTVTSRSTGCSYTQNITVSTAPAFTIDQINITDGFADTNGIEVIAVVAAGAQLEYALDEGAYQDSNFFLDVSPGTHTVWVKVKGINACAISKVVTVLNYPKFFTPNNDGYNDTWNIWALKQQPEAKIYIFDRQGKLLKQISPNGDGWDGTFNGQPLPSTDYWFKAEFIEPNTGLPKEATGHFSLKR